ncbi:MAG: arylsulfatase [Bacteroidetes bacterium]|nr:arylsulfatase [Bacteroidota bacterium]
MNCLTCWTILLLLVCSASGCAPEAPEASHAAEDRPNVILVITDDQGYGDVAAHGNPMIQTPNLDRLYGESVRLTDFHVDPTCSPTRAALMTGRYSTRTGVWHTIRGRSLMHPDEVTLAEVFAEAGYRTGMVGKWHLGDNFPLRPQDQGFEEAFYHPAGGVGQGPDFFGNDYFDDTYVRNGVLEKVDGYVTDVWFDDALTFIEKRRDEPFFLYLSTNAAHGPYYVEERYSKPYADKGVPDTMARFLGMITNLDENMGRLLAQLEAWSLAENTILIFMTDNGSAEGWANWRKEEGTWTGFNAGMREGKGSEYDGGHRVPFFVRWPQGGLGGGQDADQLTAHIDVLPTLADLCGLDLPDGVALDGTSLASILHGDTKALRDRTLLVHSQRVADPIKWRKSAVMTERWRLVNRDELYDIEADPAQQNDLAAHHPDVVEDLRAAYEAWWTSLSTAFDGYVRIGIGADAENPIHLSPHDWHTTDHEQSIWNHRQVRAGQMGNGYWAVNVAQAGTYEVELRRWPRHLDEPIEATHARLKVGEEEWEQEVSADATEATFTVTLAPGPTTLQTWLTTPDDQTRGAYFVYVERLD